MATLILPAGKNILTLNNSGIDVVDGETNDPFFLVDYTGFMASSTTTEGTFGYPCYIDNADTSLVWNGGRFYGNIPASMDWDTFYMGFATEAQARAGTSTLKRMNSAAMFIRNDAINITINGTEWGIRDNPDSGYVDGLRVNRAGTVVVNGVRVWIGRDDWMEADGGFRDITINDSFFENLFVWISSTSDTRARTIRVNRSLVHIGQHRYDWALRYGSPIKVDNAANSPTFLFQDVVISIGPNDYTDGNRMIAALSKTTCSGECRLLVRNGTHSNAALISAYQAAGFTVLQDGAGSAATDEWNARKAAFLSEGGGGGGANPDPAPSFNGIVTGKVICTSGFATPADDAQLISWFSPTDDSTIVKTGSSVSAWNAKLGTGSLIQGTAAAQPSAGTRTANLRSVIDGDSGDFLAGLITLPADGDYAVHLAGIIDGVDNAFDTLIAMNTAWQLEAGNASTFNGFLRVDGSVDTDLTGGPFSGLVIVSLIWNATAGTKEIWVNGVQRAGGAYGGAHATTQSLKVLTNRAQNQVLDGAICDVIITGDITRRTEHEDFLNARWTA